ncbi:MAG: ABC transporter ATP-binding protein [Deltaproteobacteria bacterium]|nr:ABC transporter ATP-binding protein [Deltaproteobacteria bacterium]
MKALEIKNLGIQFGGLKAVQNVSLHVNEYELVGLIGPNGAGKTTLFNLITGIYKPTTGSVEMDGKNIAGLSSFEITNECFGARTFQNIRLFKDLSVLENVLVSSHKKIDYNLWSVLFDTQHYRNSEKKIREEAMELLKIFSLDSKADEIAKNLPYGDQRKLEIVRAMSTKPKILFLDEPAAGMNEHETLQLLNLVRFVREKYKIGILVIEHDMKFIMGLCERIYVLDHGQLIAEGRPEEIRSNKDVIKAYLGEEETNTAVRSNLHGR